MITRTIEANSPIARLPSGVFQTLEPYLCDVLIFDERNDKRFIARVDLSIPVS